VLFSQPFSSGTVNMQVPLGTYFTLSLREKQNPLDPVLTIPVSFTILTSDPLPQRPLLSSASQVPKMRQLFGTRVLIRFDAAPPPGDVVPSQSFMAVHLGTATVRLLAPVAAPSPLVHITVVPPDQLGSTTNNEWTSYLVNLAQDSGIPPQYLKGQVEQENNKALFKTTFSAVNWRYEPCGVDIDQISGGAAPLIDTDAEFKPFKLDQAIGVTITPHVADELDPRSLFWVKRPDASGTLIERHVTDDDRDVTAREIWDSNNKVHFKWNFDAGCLPSKLKLINDAATSPTALAFNAQTPTASSSGLFQVMWQEAVTDEWAGVLTGVKHPKYLFDRPEYVNIGGGSGSLACNLHIQHWITKKVPIDSGSFTTLAAFENILDSVIKKYNPHYVENGKHYGTLVIEKSRNYPPRLPATIFQ
jgi:hypothetical protein